MIGSAHRHQDDKYDNMTGAERASHWRAEIEAYNGDYEDLISKTEKSLWTDDPFYSDKDVINAIIRSKENQYQKALIARTAENLSKQKAEQKAEQEIKSRLAAAKTKAEIDRLNEISQAQAKLAQDTKDRDMKDVQASMIEYNARIGKEKMEDMELANAKQLRKQKMSHRFEHGVLISKFIVLVVLLVVSFVNANVEFIAKEPQKFLGEAMLVGTTTAVATAVIGLTRLASWSTILNAMLLAFMVFFIFHILMEFSGMNGLMVVDETTLTEEQRAERALIESNIKITAQVVGSVFALIGTGMLYMVYQVRDFKNFRTAKLSYLWEALIFAALSAMPSYLIDTNRGYKSDEAGLNLSKMVAMYGSGYLMLQAGGFFSNIFGEMPAQQPTWRKPKVV